MDDVSIRSRTPAALRSQHLPQQVLLYLRQASWAVFFRKAIGVARLFRSANDKSRNPTAHPSTSRCRRV